MYIKNIKLRNLAMKLKAPFTCLVLVMIVVFCYGLSSYSNLHPLYINDYKYSEDVTLEFSMRLGKSLEEKLPNHEIYSHSNKKQMFKRDIIVSIPTIELKHLEVNEKGEIVKIEYEEISEEEENILQ